MVGLNLRFQVLGVFLELQSEKKNLIFFLFSPQYIKATYNKKVFFVLHPIEPILASVGEDQVLIIYNTNTNKILLQ